MKKIINLFLLLIISSGCNGNLFNDALNSAKNNYPSPSTEAVKWEEAYLGVVSTLQMGKVAVGKARGDEITRVYAGESEGPDGNIYEYSYSSSTWTKTIISTTLTTVYALAISDLGNGLNLYTGGNGFAEFVYSGSAWTGGKKSIPVTDGIQWINGFDIGKAKNDDINRVYIADWDRIVEIPYDYANWSGVEISTDSEWVCSIVVADGRNDNTYRLYAIVGTFNGPVWEYTWNGSSWDIAECSDLATTAQDFRIITAGTGRNDGKTRLYAWGDSGLFEFSYNNGWKSTVIATVPFSALTLGVLGDMIIADGRNDGFNRLYTADDNGVGEYTYAGSWQKTGLLNSNPTSGIAIGNGRNDPVSVNRVYSTSGTYLFEYTAQYD